MIPEGTVFWGVVIKQFILGATAFAAGVLLFRAIVTERKRRRPFLITGLVGVTGVLLLVGELVVRAPLINPEWRAIAYLICLLMIFVGFMGDAIRNKKRYEERLYEGNTDRRKDRGA